ncbi:MAG: hypothetical protein KBF89_03735 [Acidimicrobiia bacterium]|nr:hypothetical protein [Acidimicrobiia bacterium]
MESFFDKLNAAETNEDKNTAYEFEAVYSELDLIKDSVEAKPIRSSSGNEYIFIPKNCLQTFENIDETCIIRFKSTVENLPIDGSVLVSPLSAGDHTDIFSQDFVETAVWQMTEADEDMLNYEVTEVSKVQKLQDQGIFLDYSIQYDDAVVRNIQFITLKNNNYYIATVSISENTAEQLGQGAFTSALSLSV